MLLKSHATEARQEILRPPSENCSGSNSMEAWWIPRVQACRVVCGARENVAYSAEGVVTARNASGKRRGSAVAGRSAFVLLQTACSQRYRECWGVVILVMEDGALRPGNGVAPKVVIVQVRGEYACYLK